MRLRYGVILGATLVFTGFVIATFPTRQSQPDAALAPTNEEILISEQQKPVGWVFGRVMGVPGADRPLMSASGSYGGRPNLPVTGNGR